MDENAAARLGEPNANGDSQTDQPPAPLARMVASCLVAARGIGEQHYRGLVAAAHDGLLLADADGRILAANRRAGELLGRAPDRLLGESLLERTGRTVRPDGTVVSFDDWPLVMTLRTERPCTGMILSVGGGGDGTPRWLSVSTRPLRLGPGRSDDGQAQRGDEDARYDASLGVAAPLVGTARSELAVGITITDVTAQVRRERQQAAILRLARHLAGESSRDELLNLLLDEAVALFDADSGGVAAWEPATRRLTQILGHAVRRDVVGSELCLRHSAIGRAVETGQRVVVNDYQRLIGATTPAGTDGAHAVMAAPLRYEGRLLGGISVSSTRPGRAFDDEEAETLELLAGIGAASMVGHERAQLEGAVLAARTAQHEVNNRLALTVGFLDLLAADVRLDERQQALVAEAVAGAEQATRALASLCSISRLERAPYGSGLPATLDLDIDRASS